MRHKKQHYIPECYLKPWCDSRTPSGQKPYVWVIAPDGTSSRKRAPSNIFHERDFYTLSDPTGGRDLVLEHGLSQLESRFTQVRRRLEHGFTLTSTERLVLCAFAAAMHSRTKVHRDHWRQTWQRVLDMGNRLSEWAETATPEQLESMAGVMPIGEDENLLSQEDVQGMVDEPVASLLPASIEIATPVLMQMNLTILETDDKTGFLTSDNPCVWTDPTAHARPRHQQFRGLANPNIEITLPISPHQMVTFSWRGPLWRHNIDRLRAADNKTLLLDEINRRTRVHAAEAIIANSNSHRDYWFKDFQHPDSATEP